MANQGLNPLGMDGHEIGCCSCRCITAVSPSKTLHAFDAGGCSCQWMDLSSRLVSGPQPDLRAEYMERLATVAHGLDHDINTKMQAASRVMLLFANCCHTTEAAVK